jgi:diadenosine tetraphosphate (Ap4A) HIT family hydrolase
MNKWLLYEDALIQIRLSEHPMSKGHIEVLPVKDVCNMSDLSDDEMQHLFFGASYAATALFEFLGAHGTNIILNESDSQLIVHVIARFQGDGLDYLWEPKPSSPEDLKDTAKSIRDKVDYELWVKENPQKANEGSSEKTQEVLSSPDSGKKEENYLLRSLRRIP